MSRNLFAYCIIALAAAFIGLQPTAARAASPYGPVCSNGEYLGDNGVSAAGQQWETRYIYYCPQGAKVIQLLFTGGYADGVIPVEHQLVDPQVMNLSVETFVPPVWNPTLTYAVGDQVSGPIASNNGSGTYIAVAPSTNSLPTARNTGAWKVTTPQPIPLTCNHVRPCVLGTTTVNGKTVTIPLLSTDPLAVNIPPHTLIAIRSYVKQSGSQVMANGPDQTIRAGSYQQFAPTEADLTLSGSRTGGGSAHNTGPFAIIGLQNTPVPKPSVCILGDSRIAGISGYGVSYALVQNGGSGYVSDDIGRLVMNVDTGGTPNVAFHPAQYVIQNVVNGKVTSVGVYFPGHYAIPVTSTAPGVASVLPVGPQPTHPMYGTTGTGLVVNIAANGMSGSAGVYEDAASFAQGFVQKGLSDAGIPFSSFSRSSDRVSIWAAPGGDALRLPAIKATGCTSAIMGYGIKDSNAGESATQIESEYVTVAKQVLALGTVKAVYLATIAPQTDSTDYWTTVHNQVAVGYDLTRQAVNTWDRGNPAPFSGTFDVAFPIEVNAANVPTKNGGFWIVNGTPHYGTMDRTHLSPATQMLAATVITNNVGILK